MRACVQYVGETEDKCPLFHHPALYRYAAANHLFRLLGQSDKNKCTRYSTSSTSTSGREVGDREVTGAFERPGVPFIEVGAAPFPPSSRLGLLSFFLCLLVGRFINKKNSMETQKPVGSNF